MYNYLGKCGLELIDFGSTWTRKQESALDHALIKKPEANKNYFKIQIDYLLRPQSHVCGCINYTKE